MIFHIKSVQNDENQFKMLGLILRHPIPKILLAQVQSVHGITQKYLKCDKSMFSAAMAVRTFLTKCTRLSDGVTRSTSFLKSNGLHDCTNKQNLLVQRRQMSQFDVNLNVLNNVVLYKFDRHLYFRNLHIFGIGQLFGWSVLAVYTYKPSFWDIFNTDVNFKEYWINNFIRLSTFLISIFIGPLTFLFIYALCARSIKYIILNKGGKTLSIITYHLRKKKSKLNLSVGMAKCTSDRKEIAGCLPFKIQNKPFYYLIDKNGTFVNPKLFDHAMG